MADVYLIGDPVAHSLSPAMQNAAFAASGLPHEYKLMHVKADDLSDAVRRIRDEGSLGANVTIPHKEAIGQHVDVVEGSARRIGAVNTLFKRGTTLHGDNTDVGGFADALAEQNIDVGGKRVLLLGAGGAAKACLDHLIRTCGDAVVVNRTPARAREMLEGALRALPRGAMGQRSFGFYQWPVRTLQHIDVIVNATSLGIAGEDPLEGIELPRSVVVVDIVATTEETPLIRRAKASGCVAVDGLLMLLHQGVRAFRLWTGLDAPLATMRAALPRKV